jgi:hypothetical protein
LYYDVWNTFKLSFLLKLFKITETGKKDSRVIVIEKRNIRDNLKIILEKFN